MIISNHIDQLDSMYPAASWLLKDQHLELPDFCRWGSIYGYSFGSTDISVNGNTYHVDCGQYFSFWCGKHPAWVTAQHMVWIVVCLGYKSQNVTGWVEPQGRLSYINGCTDSLLVYPPRMGDPSLNLLTFPAGIEQDQHLHPSIRLGCVIQGQGVSDVWNHDSMVSHDLTTHSSFCLVENERHRFRTLSHAMTVLAWHPDGDWGPTDHNHTMLNRTYITK